MSRCHQYVTRIYEKVLVLAILSHHHSCKTQNSNNKPKVIYSNTMQLKPVCLLRTYQNPQPGWHSNSELIFSISFLKACHGVKHTVIRHLIENLAQGESERRALFLVIKSCHLCSH